MAYDQIDSADLDGKNTRGLFEQVDGNFEAIKGGTTGSAPVSTIKDLNDAVVSLDGRLDTAEGDISALEAEFAVEIKIPTGSVIRNAGTATPSGFLLCDGSSKLRATYPDLFAALTDDEGAVTFDIVNDLVLMTAHPFVAGDKVSFEGNGPVPVEITKGTTYFVVNPTTDNFQVEPSLGGGAITFTWPEIGLRRSVAGVTFDGVNDDVQYTSHPFVENDPVVFDGSGTMPTGLTKGTTYYVVSPGVNSFKLEASIGGGAIDFTDNGAGSITVYRALGTLSNSPVEQFDYADDNLNKADHSFVANDIVELYDPYASPQPSFVAPTGLAKATPYYVRNPDASIGAVTMTAVDDLISINAHGIDENDPIVFSGGGTPSAEIVLGTVYYARDVLTNSFKVAATPGGAAFDLTTDSSGTVNVAVKAFELAATNGGAKISFSKENVDAISCPWGVADTTHFNVPTNPDTAPWTNIIRHGA